MYTLIDWIPIDKINWEGLSENPNAIHLLEQNLQENQEDKNWYGLSENPNAIPLSEQHLDKINWKKLCGNPNAIPLSEQHLDKINWKKLSKNPSLNPNIFTYDYKKMKETNNWLLRELVEYLYHPKQFSKFK